MRQRLTTLGTVAGLSVVVVSIAQWSGIAAGIFGGVALVAVCEIEGRK